MQFVLRMTMVGWKQVALASSVLVAGCTDVDARPPEHFRHITLDVRFDSSLSLQQKQTFLAALADDANDQKSIFRYHLRAKER